MIGAIGRRCATRGDRDYLRFMHRAVSLLLCAIVGSAVLACVIDSDNSSFATFAAGEDGIGSSDAGDGAAELHDSVHYANSGDSDGGSTGEGSDDEQSSADPIKFDLPDPEPPAESDAPCGVDILFVIDNSGSMSQHKNNIVEAFDSFIDEMIAALVPGTPVHVAVTRATGFFDPGNGSGWSEPSCVFGFLDGTWSPPELVDNNVNGQQGRLFENDGQRYFEYRIGDDATVLAQWFEA